MPNCSGGRIPFYKDIPKMWLWILIGLSIITKVHGYANGFFPESCASMLPEHKRAGGVLYTPRDTVPPFEVRYQHGKKGDPITVSLLSKQGQNTKFRGFMLEARENGMVDNGLPVGKFISLDTRSTRLLTCNGVSNSAVSQRNNQQKNLIQVNWTAEGAELNIIFRATFVETYGIFWERVDVDVPLPPSTTPPPTSTTASTTTSTTEPSTTTSTTEPSTTEPSTTTSTTEPSTTKRSTTTSTTEPSTTEASTTTSTTEPSTTSNKKWKQGVVAAVVMTWDIVFVVLKTELPVVITIFTNSPTHHLNKESKILCCLLCAAAEILSMTLFGLGETFKVTLFALTCVVMGINLTKLVIVSLPIGPSHELNEICHLAVRVCSVIHKFLAIAVIFLVVMEIDDGKECWLLKVMIAYTVWISLFVIWIFLFSICGKEILGRSKTGSSETSESRRQQRKKKKLNAAEGTVFTISVIFVVGTISFTFAVNFGLCCCM